MMGSVFTFEHLLAPEHFPSVLLVVAILARRLFFLPIFGLARHPHEGVMGVVAVYHVFVSLLVILGLLVPLLSPQSLLHVPLVTCPHILIALMVLSRRVEMTKRHLVFCTTNVAASAVLLLGSRPGIAVLPLLANMYSLRKSTSGRPSLIMAGLLGVLIAHQVKFSDRAWVTVVFEMTLFYLVKFKMPGLFTFDRLVFPPDTDEEHQVVMMHDMLSSSAQAPQAPSPPVLNPLVDILRTDSGTSESTTITHPGHHRRQSSQASTGWAWGIETQDDLPSTPALVSSDEDDEQAY
jgi:hypothetical protein